MTAWPTQITITDTETQAGPGYVSGYIQYQLNVPLTNSATGAVWSHTTYRVPFLNGVATAVVPVVDDPTTTPSGAWYTVSKTISGAPEVLPWLIQPLRSMGPSISLGSITPSTPLPPVLPFATSAQLAAEATTRAAADTANATAIASEATTRATADTANATAISSEATTRAAADTTNATAISAEATTARAAESANATAITNEATTARAAEATKAQALIPTAVKTANYTAVAADLVPCDTTSGAFTITLPNAPADKTRVAVKVVILGGTNAVTVACAGSDVFNKTGGATTASLSLLAQAIQVQYKASTGIWYVVADDLPLTQLDARYVALSAIGHDPDDLSLTITGSF